MDSAKNHPKEHKTNAALKHATSLNIHDRNITVLVRTRSGSYYHSHDISYYPDKIELVVDKVPKKVPPATGAQVKSSSSSSASGIIHEYYEWVDLLHGNVTVKQTEGKDGFKPESFSVLDEVSQRILFRFCLCDPEVEIKKRDLFYWCAGEDVTAVPTQEEVDAKLAKLAKDGFIEHVADMQKKKGPTSRFRMAQHVWSAVRDDHPLFSVWEKKVRVLKSTDQCGSCNFKPLGGAQESVGKNKIPHAKVEILFNQDKSMLDMDGNWLLGLKDVRILQMGRIKWRPNTHHIEVKDTGKLFKDIEGLKELQFLSFQGVSGILELPSSIRKLHNLRILDLRACHNLELLPTEIKSLKKLTHLDLSGCLVLDHMPKGIASLSELRVLKGFVICDREKYSACSFTALSKLDKLEELSVLTKMKKFPTKHDLCTIAGMQKLQKLKISWGGPTKNRHAKSTWAETTDARTWPQIQKLELRAAPQEAATLLLDPGRLQHVTKLYITGGKVHDVGQWGQGIKHASVKVVRFKFLAKLRMDWRQFMGLFPNVAYLEMIHCPKLALFPCDSSNGVWTKQTTES